MADTRKRLGEETQVSTGILSLLGVIAGGGVRRLNIAALKEFLGMGTGSTNEFVGTTDTKTLTNKSVDQLKFAELAANGSNYVGLKAPDDLPSTTTYTLPSADGSAGMALKTDGAANLSFGAASSYAFISAQNVTAQATIDFTTGFSSAFDEYRFVLIGVYPSTAGSDIYMRVSENAGSSFTATGYYRAQQGFVNGVASGDGNGSTSRTEHPLTITAGPNNAAADGLTGEANLFLTATRANIMSRAGWKNNSGTVANQMNVFSAWTMTATASRVNAVRFLASSGNINGKILMYGITNA